MHELGVVFTTIDTLEELGRETRTMVIYEAPHRLVRTLEELAGVLGDRPLTICKELTKKHETFHMTSLQGALSMYRETEPRGEYVLVIAGKPEEELEAERAMQYEGLSLADHMRKYLAEGKEEKEAMKAVAADRGISKREVYRAWLEEKD